MHLWMCVVPAADLYLTQVGRVNMVGSEVVITNDVDKVQISRRYYIHPQVNVLTKHV